MTLKQFLTELKKLKWRWTQFGRRKSIRLLGAPECPVVAVYEKVTGNKAIHPVFGFSAGDALGLEERLKKRIISSVDGDQGCDEKMRRLIAKCCGLTESE